MLEGYGKRIPVHLKSYAPFPPGSERIGWEALPPETITKLVSRGEDYLNFTWPSLYVTDWLAYTRTGNRVDFEEKYFLRRRALCALVLAECAQYKGYFINDILNGIYAICEESAWQLPAHNNYVRDTPALSLPDTDRPVLDLFACETGALLATAYYLLREQFDSINPLVTRRLENELKNRIIHPYIKEWVWWMGGRNEVTCNWTVWCTQNILLTVFLSPFSEEMRHRVACKATESIDAFLNDYGEDGCCDEGAQYYRHAGLCLSGALDVLDQVTDGLFTPFWQEEKIRNIARYILHVHVDGPYYINFADCSPIAGQAGVREYLFGKRCCDEALCDFAAVGWQSTVDKDLPEEINLFTGRRLPLRHRK